MKKFFSCALFAMLAVMAAAQPCTNLFISEYVEGSGNNKALEIYNPTSNPISLTGYKLYRYTNGSDTVSASFDLAGTIAPGDVYVIVNSQSSPAILATRDTSTSVVNFNGDDAVALVQDTVIIDVIGEIGTDPGTSWTVGTGATAEFTLIRKPSTQLGSTDWTTGVNEWNVLQRDSIQLGAHTMTSCGDTTVRFAAVAATAAEPAGFYTVDVVLSQASPSAKTVDVTLLSGDAADVAGFTTVTVTIPSNATSAPVIINITNDTLAESAETFEFILSNTSGGVSLDADSIFALTITDDDSIVPPPPFYPIAAITTVDVDGLPDSLGVQCRVRGVVYGINLRDSGLQFTIHDGTGGIGVFSTSDFGYVVQEGDSVVVSGEVGEFAGYTQMEELDSVYELGTGTLRAPQLVTSLGEATESELIRVNNLTLVNPSQWDNSNPAGFTVDVSNGTLTFQMRVEEQTDLYNANAPTGLFDLVGLGSQFDNTAPHDEGYQIVPRSTDDVLLRTGIHDAAGIEFAVCPNPNDGVFTIKLDGQRMNGFTVKVIDLTGRLVLSETRKLNNSTTVIDLSQAARGFYLVEVAAENAVLRKKVSIR